MISSSSSGFHIARQINWSIRWLAVYTIQINKYRRRHLLSSSCPHMPHRTRLKEVHVVTLHLVHRVARSTSAALCHLRQAAVFSCSIVVVNLLVYMAKLDSVKIVQHWLLHSKIVTVRLLQNHASKCKVRIMPQTLRRINKVTRRCLSIRNLHRQTVQLYNLWWQATLKTLEIMLSQKLIDKTCSIQDKKRAVPHLLALLAHKTRNQSNLSKIRSLVKQTL